MEFSFDEELRVWCTVGVASGVIVGSGYLIPETSLSSLNASDVRNDDLLISTFVDVLICLFADFAVSCLVFPGFPLEGGLGVTFGAKFFSLVKGEDKLELLEVDFGTPCIAC